jgi:hypothetical protein
MPTTLFSLILFTFFILPGAIYTFRRQRLFPARDRTIFGETVSVTVAGILLYLAPFVLLMMLARFWPDAIVDVGEIISNPKSYLSENWARVGIWMILILIASIGLAFLMSSGRFANLHPSDSSSWEMLFETWRARIAKSHDCEIDVQVGCELDDGSWIGGILADYNRMAKETGDRDLTLFQPIRYRARGRTEAVPYNSVGAVCISSRNIRAMFITWGKQGFAEKQDLGVRSATVSNQPEQTKVEFSATNMENLSVTFGSGAITGRQVEGLVEEGAPAGSSPEAEDP